MKRIALMILLGMVLCVPTAQAKEKASRYLSFTTGASLLSDSDVSVQDIEFATFNFDPGFNLGGALGFDFGNYRVEGEVMYRHWNADSFTIPGSVGGVAIAGCPCTGGADGALTSFGLMANGYYDFTIANSPIEPYLGGGIGFSNIDEGDETDIVFAYQFMAGIGYALNQQATFTLGYRYFETTNPEFEFSGISQPIEAEIQSHEFNVGIRLAF